MKKPFLLIAWDLYMPDGGTKDWMGFYETYEEAKQQVSIDPKYNYYVVNGSSYDVYEIVDLREWTEAE